MSFPEIEEFRGMVFSYPFQLSNYVEGRSFEPYFKVNCLLKTVSDQLDSDHVQALRESRFNDRVSALCSRLY